MLNLTNNTFQNNIAELKGGAIYYSLQRPIMKNLSFLNNSAEYGDNLASYPVKIIDYETSIHKISIDSVGSGITHNGIIKVALVDYDHQLMSIEDDANVKIMAMSNSTSVKGTNLERFHQGVASFSGVKFYAKPGSQDVPFLFYSDSISPQQLYYGLGVFANSTEYLNLINVSFRYCQPGEMETSNS